MAWMEDLPTWLHMANGTAEIPGGLGPVLPAATRIRPRLTPMAAAGLATVMVLVALWHVPRGEIPNVALTLVLAIVLMWLARVRWRSHPIGLPPGSATKATVPTPWIWVGGIKAVVAWRSPSPAAPSSSVWVGRPAFCDGGCYVVMPQSSVRNATSAPLSRGVGHEGCGLRTVRGAGRPRDP
jgi:hypothetical protein